MKKDWEILHIRNQIEKEINRLDRKKIHVLYFSYYFNFHNIFKNPLLIFSKLLNLYNGDKSIDHVTHISRFYYDLHIQKWEAKIFEASIEGGMEENDLYNKLKSFQGICYIETLDIKIDKDKAKSFENKYYGIPYSIELAAMSGIDIDFLDKNLKKTKRNGGFCSWLTSLFLIDQGIDLSKIEKGNPLEIVPADLFHANLAEKRIFYKY